MSPADGSERRQHKRVPFIQDVEVAGVGSLRCSDISIGGMYLETLNEFSEGTQITIRFKFQMGDPEPVEIQARVSYVHPNVGIGVVFENTPHDVLQKIQALVEGN